MMAAMLAEAKVAVIGGGVAGCSLLYQLARLGWTDTVLLEQHELTSGSTWHAAGLCTQFNQSYNVMALLRRSVELYETLEGETGQAVDYHRCGSVRIATTEDRVHQFHHVAGIAASVGVPFELVSPERAHELFPLMDPGGVIAAAYLPTDGHVDPSGLTGAFAGGATSLGARILRHTPVTGLERGPGGWVIETPKGEVRARIVVNAAGQWGREVASLAGHDLPLVPMQHHYLVTEPIEEIAARDAELPVFRDPDRSFYCRQEHGGLLVGPFERDPVPWALDGIPDGFHSRLLPDDLDRIAPYLESAGERIPAFAEAGIRTVVNGPDAYTPDGRCLMGWVPGPRDMFVLAGFSIFGIVFAGGAGAYAAEWIVDGQPSDNMWELDVRRFGPYANPTSYVVARASEVFEDEYKIHYPEEERPAGRPLKTDPLYERLVAKGAVMGVRFGWERPLWFARDGEEPRDDYSFRRGNWFEAVGDECRGVRSAVGVLDQTSFAKFLVSRPGAEAFLDRLCANRLPAEPGRISLTQMLTAKGGIECDLTVTRVRSDRFLVISAAATETHDLGWIERHDPGDGSVQIENVTARYGVLTLAGPRSRELLSRLAREDVSREAFPFFRARHLEVAGMRLLVLRVSYVGELGYELHHPLELQRVLYDRLWDAGADLGLVDFGYRALESLRLEKGYRLWGADMSADYTPLEAGLERFVAFDKGDFVGREALLAREVRIRLSTLVVDAGDADAHGYEPVYVGGELVTYVMAGGYGHTVGESIALAYLPLEHAREGTEVEVEILGERRPARVVADALHDPAGERLRS
jgi:glycine cleavage system aminomethyltransferase T/glycine/D-amino acid oxidase-like deaminating enzyme